MRPDSRATFFLANLRTFLIFQELEKHLYFFPALHDFYKENVKTGRSSLYRKVATHKASTNNRVDIISPG